MVRTGRVAQAKAGGQSGWNPTVPRLDAWFRAYPRVFALVSFVIHLFRAKSWPRLFLGDQAELVWILRQQRGRRLHLFLVQETY